MTQRTVFMMNLSRLFIIFKHHINILLGDFNTTLGIEDFSNRQLGMRVYIRIVMKWCQHSKFCHVKKSVV